MIAARASRIRLGMVVAVLSIALVGVLLLATVLGVENIDWSAAWRSGTPDHAIVVRVRLGRAFLGAVVGGAVAAAGVTLQTRVRNPRADPYVLGGSSGAT
ncbi:MAG: iron chelate uptake ABC transporter family permease subunit, partial [Deltaproteobacteria bacterium]|nr:iron chelate uptake ABC transporter family permease subunit [Deltaproteobacteria bacterium]